MTRWITTARAAEIIGCCERQVRRLVADGFLAARRARARGRWQIELASAEALAGLYAATELFEVVADALDDDEFSRDGQGRTETD